MRTAGRRTARAAASAALVTAVVTGLATGAQAVERPQKPRVDLEVAPADATGNHGWTVSFHGRHLQPADGSPSIEWVVDSYNTARSPQPVTVAAGAEADPDCRSGKPVSGQDVVDHRTEHLDARPLPRGTDRVMVFGSYCAVDGTVHRFELESDVVTGPDGQPEVLSYPLLDDRIPEQDELPRPDPGPIVDTGWQHDDTTPMAVTGAAMVALGGGLALQGRRRAR